MYYNNLKALIQVINNEVLYMHNTVIRPTYIKECC